MELSWILEYVTISMYGSSQVNFIKLCMSKRLSVVSIINILEHCLWQKNFSMVNQNSYVTLPFNICFENLYTTRMLFGNEWNYITVSNTGTIKQRDSYKSYQTCVLNKLLAIQRKMIIMIMVMIQSLITEATAEHPITEDVHTVRDPGIKSLTQFDLTGSDRRAAYPSAMWHWSSVCSSDRRGFRTNPWELRML